MANIFDYITWRGDLTLDQVPHNEIDLLILCRMSYLPLDDIVPSSFSGTITVGQAMDGFLALPNPESRVYLPADVQLAQVLKDCPRFQSLPLCGYVNCLAKDRQEQFSATTVLLNPGESFVVYRGTDNSLVGWKEDFNMGFMTPVPSQIDAVSYLEQAAQELEGTLIVGGHSKGGNLAVYASAFCSPQIQTRIPDIYNNDGPGFDSKVLETSGYHAISSRVHTFVPQSSVIGMLLDHEDDYTIVQSTQKGLFQHDLYSWQILGPNFIKLQTVTSTSRFIDKTLKDWVANLSYEQREVFFDTLFNILFDTKAETFSELSDNWYQNARVILKSLTSMDASLREGLSQTLRLLFQSARGNLSLITPRPASIPAKLKSKKADE